MQDRSEGDLNLGDARATWQRGHIDAETRALLDEDARWFLHQALSTPCLNVVERAEGIYLIDTAGRRIMDFHGNTVHQVGYGHPRVIEAATRQLATLPFSPRRYTNRAAIELARRLAELAPGRLNKVLFAPSGTAAVGMALKLARHATGRHKTVSMWDAFHGASLDAISIGGEAMFRRDAGPLLPGTEHVPPPADFWPRVRASCDRQGTLLIFDEIPSCLGRTGTMCACEQMGCVPDMLVLGKGLGGGVFPLAALIAREDLDLAADRALGHYTHEKSSVGCAAALATLDVIRDEELLERSRELGAHALERLGAMPLQAPRGLGLSFGAEVATPALAEAVMYGCLSKGLSFKLGGGTVLTLCPPLTITRGELDAALDVLESVVTFTSPALRERSARSAG
jgi:4-aminobutyrate aminotransferase